MTVTVHPVTQMLCTFSALHHNSVLIVLIWTNVGAGLIDVGLSYLVLRKQPPEEVKPALAAGVAAAGGWGCAWTASMGWL